VYADPGQALRTMQRCEARAKAEAVADKAEAAANREAKAAAEQAVT
jgi:hypothetical protein